MFTFFVEEEKHSYTQISYSLTKGIWINTRRDYGDLTRMLKKAQLKEIRDQTTPKREIGYTRGIYSYPAKFLFHLPRKIIELCTQIGDLVCDPFVGGGTTGLEAMLLNRRFIGYDLNPFAILISKVKTTYISTDILNRELKLILDNVSNDTYPNVEILDPVDKECLGDQISHEINKINSIIKTVINRPSIRSFFELALIHVIKIVGRRDFESRKDWYNRSIVPMFERKCSKMIKSVNSLPQTSKYSPEFRVGSNHTMQIVDSSVDLIITSPPYLGVDVEYQQLQIQRRSLNKSKRTEVINRILEKHPLQKSTLCWTGKKGDVYWSNLERSLIECYRVLKTNAYLCFWTGFKNSKDEKRLFEMVNQLGLVLVESIPIPMSNNRAASSRSTHHRRKTGMMKTDNLFFLQKDKL